MLKYFILFVANFLLVSSSLALTQQQEPNPYVKNMQQTFNQANSKAKSQFDKMYPKPIAPDLSGGTALNQPIKTWNSTSNVGGGYTANKGRITENTYNNNTITTPSTTTSNSQIKQEENNTSSSNIFLPPGSNTSNNPSTNIYR